MFRARIGLALTLAIVVLGSLGLTSGAAWRLRSDSYRRACAAALSAAVGLPSSIDRVVPRSMRSREFQGIEVWLPQRRARVFACRNALLERLPEPGDPDAYEIVLVNGACEISTRTWLRDDYRHVLESSLRPGFRSEGPRRVRFGRMDLSLARDEFRAELRGARGEVEFESRTRGRANAFCEELNGYVCPEPVFLSVAFSPSATGIRIDRLELDVPRLPLRALRLERLSGVADRSGQFSGRLMYEETETQRVVTASGTCRGLELAELTTGLVPQPWRGQCPEIELRELRIEDGRPTALAFRGAVRDVILGDVLSLAGLTGVEGELSLRVGDAQVSDCGVESLIASGQCLNISLQALTRALGWGEMTGVLRIRIDDLVIEDNRLARLNAEIAVADAIDEPNWVDGRLLRELVRRALRISLPPVLLERVEYTRLGLKLDVRDEQLHVFGTHGEGEKTILTARVFGREVPLVFEPPAAIDLTPWLDDLRARATEAIRGRSLRQAQAHP